jgi:hypothetical protein
VCAALSAHTGHESDWRNFPTPTSMGEKGAFNGSSKQRRLPMTDQKRDVAFVVRAPDPNNRGRWITVGAAWARKDSKPGFNVRLNSVPVGNWDGALILLPPLEAVEDSTDHQHE